MLRAGLRLGLLQGLFLGLFLGLLLGGCDEVTPGDGFCEPAVTREVYSNGIDELDLLFVIDNTGSMADEQAALREQIPALIRGLIRGELTDPVTGEVDRRFHPIRSVHAGVISTDMGAGGRALDTCDAPTFGDDGLLLSGGDPSLMGCPESPPLFLRFDAEREGAEPEVVEAFGAQVACAAGLGLDGCGYEQPLEALLKALSPASASYPGVSEAYAPPSFFMDTSGHADGANRLSEAEPFLRETSTLLVFLVTDEDDCSVADDRLFDREGPYSSVGHNERCEAYPEALHPIERYLDGLRQLRPSIDDLSLTLITGVPPDLVRDRFSLDFQQILDDPRMVGGVDPVTGRLTSACEGFSGPARPARRLVELGQALDEQRVRVSLASICEASFYSAVESSVSRLIRAPFVDCIPEPYVLNEEGLIDCRITELLREGLECEGLPGRAPLLDGAGRPVREEGRARCLLTQLDHERVRAHLREGGPDPGPGWFYNDFDAEDGRGCGSVPHFSYHDAFSRYGSTLRLECCASAYAE